MTIADEARDNALHCEMVKYAYRQTKDGIVVSFVVHPNDIPAALSISHIGARFMVALVQIGDDELPVQKEAPAAPRQADPPSSRSDGAKRKPWETLLPQQQAAMHSHEPIFAAFLKENYPDEWHETADANECLKLICGVTSKRDLELNHKARVIWMQLDSHFQAWRAKERVGA